jgi:hypothetical protein
MKPFRKFEFVGHHPRGGEGGFGFPIPKRHGTGAPPAPVTTTPWTENAPRTQAMTTAPPRTAGPRPDTGLPFEQSHTLQGSQQMQAHARQPTAEPETVPWRSKLAGKQAATTVQLHVSPQHESTLEAERILMMDFASTQAWAKEVAPPASHEGGGGRWRPLWPSPCALHLCSPPTGWTRCTANWLRAMPSPPHS